MRDFTWSKTEKEAARRAFDLAANRECEAIRREVESMLERTKDPYIVWRIEDYLYERRREFDQKYDYRYSMLILVFARLINEEWLKEEELAGLREDKLEAIRKVLSIR
jgi:hypothetical protein